MKPLHFFFWHSCLIFLNCNYQVDGNYSQLQEHPALRIHNFTVLPSHNFTFVYTNDSAYSNFSATVDIIEGTVNKGIFFREKKGVTFLYFGSHKNSCISNPMQCGPEGVTFSFFWKTQREQPRLVPSAYRGQVFSNGFKVCSSEGKGSVEFYTRGNSMKWEASFSPPGPYWTHVLFTWKSKEGLKVYVNGTLNTTDPDGKVSHNYGEPNVNLVIEPEGPQSRHYENGAFDEFIIWERALTPSEIEMYFTAAIDRQAYTWDPCVQGTSRGNESQQPQRLFPVQPQLCLYPRMQQTRPRRRLREL